MIVFFWEICYTKRKGTLGHCGMPCPARRKLMETRIQEIAARGNKNIKIRVIPGHFATNHSHVNYYVDMTSIKSSHRMARNAAVELSRKYLTTTPIDTIICLEGTEMIGAFLANELGQSGNMIMNGGNDIHVITPELNSNNQMIFRDNTQKMIWGKNILLLISSASTGKTINRSIECLQYYSGRLVGISAIFSAIPVSNGVEINAIFTDQDLPHYQTMLSTECDLCKKGQKIDAIVNSFGYSKI